MDAINSIKQKLAREIAAQDGRDNPKHQVAAFRQKDRHLTLASSSKGWAKTWRQNAINDLPDTVASIKKARAHVGRSTKVFDYLIFCDADGTELLAVQPRYNNSIYKYEILNGQTLADVLGKDWKVAIAA